jgi:OCT family organic cation transporter-like MFS transporter 4/5
VLIVAPSVDRFGRHNIVSLGQLVGGAACIACANVGGGITQAALAAIGKFGCSGNTDQVAGVCWVSCRKCCSC